MQSQYQYIYICLIISIKLEVWTITHCLESGHETTVCTVRLSIFLLIFVCNLSFARLRHCWGQIPVLKSRRHLTLIFRRCSIWHSASVYLGNDPLMSCYSVPNSLTLIAWSWPELGLHCDEETTWFSTLGLSAFSKYISVYMKNMFRTLLI